MLWNRRVRKYSKIKFKIKYKMVKEKEEGKEKA